MVLCPSNIRKQFNQAQKTLAEMTRELGYVPSDEQLAEKLNITVEKMYKLFENARAKYFLSIHGINGEIPALAESLASQNTDEPGQRLEKQELNEKLAGQINELDTNLRRIVILYYNKELTMKEIALVLKVTESRVSQLHASALFKLSCRLRQWKYDG